MPTQATAEKIIPISEAKTQTPEILKSKGYQRPILEILADLQKPIPKRFIKSKTLKGQRIDFVSWYSYISLLEFYSPGFSWEVRTHYNGEAQARRKSFAPSSKVASPSAPPKAILSAKPPEPKTTRSIAGATHPVTLRRWR
ncbi:hypothetical protein [Altericista sp. CCNU0014]|uniref:hypothetical protein n=1 Tax=Altericista sp. CCNU0014 TaxID=3082949 RepID=UPI00384A59FF